MYSCVSADLYNETSLEHAEFRTYFNRLFSIMASYNLYTRPELVDGIGEKLLTKYFQSGDINDNTHSNAVDVIRSAIIFVWRILFIYCFVNASNPELWFQLFTDSCFAQCVLNMAYRLSSPVYAYLYDYQNEFSYNRVFGACKKPLGVTHGDELNSLFKMSRLNPNELNANDLEVSRLAINIWYTFAASK